MGGLQVGEAVATGGPTRRGRSASAPRPPPGRSAKLSRCSAGRNPLLSAGRQVTPGPTVGLDARPAERLRIFFLLCRTHPATPTAPAPWPTPCARSSTCADKGPYASRTSATIWASPVPPPTGCSPRSAHTASSSRSRAAAVTVRAPPWPACPGRAATNAISSAPPAPSWSGCATRPRRPPICWCWPGPTPSSWTAWRARSSCASPSAPATTYRPTRRPAARRC